MELITVPQVTAIPTSRPRWGRIMKPASRLFSVRPNKPCTPIGGSIMSCAVLAEYTGLKWIDTAIPRPAHAF